MDETTAWLQQAIADRNAAEPFIVDGQMPIPCHAIAKWQQSVEKAIKSLIAALRDAKILAIQIGYKHEVERFIHALVRLPRAITNRAIQNHLHKLLDQETRAGIRDLEALAPRRPAPGDVPRRNTEYPFLDENLEWTYPAEDAVFSQTEVERFRGLAHRVVDRVRRIVSMIRRTPN